MCEGIEDATAREAALMAMKSQIVKLKRAFYDG
jgi:hypothetical protein